MSLDLVQVNIKASNDQALGRFWADVLGWDTSSEGPNVTNIEPPGFTWPHPSAVCIDVVATPDPETVQYRTHIDLATQSERHYKEITEKLLKLGAVTSSAALSDSRGTVYTDPEGNHFCVLEPDEKYSDTGPIAAVVIDSDEPTTLGRFWAQVIGWVEHDATDDFVRLRSKENVGPYLEFVRHKSPDAMQSRMHLDLLPPIIGSQQQEVSRLVRLGAKLVDIGQGNSPWKVLEDHEGNDFCVLEPR